MKEGYELSPAGLAERAELDAEDELIWNRAIDMCARALIAEREITKHTKRTLPTLTTRAGVQKYIGEVTNAVNRKELSGADARVLLYSAQLALSSLKADEKRRPVGRPKGTSA